MPLPFTVGKVPGQINATRDPSGGFIQDSDDNVGNLVQPDSNEGDSDDGLMAAASELIKAVHAGDESGVANAFRSAFQILESAPHEEYEPMAEEEEIEGIE